VGWCILLAEILSPFYLALQNHILSGSDTLHVIISPYTELKILFLIFGIYMLSFILQHGQYLEEEHRGTI